jgi:signal transduction histidine kinase
MKKLRHFFSGFIEPEEINNDDARYAYMTRVILRMMGITLVIFTPVVFLIELSVPPPYEGVFLILLIDFPVFVAWAFAEKGRWRPASHIPPAIFLVMGFYGIWANGLGTTFLLFFALVIVIVGMYVPIWKQLIFYGIIVIGAVSLAWIRDHDLELVLSPAITMSGLLMGVLLMQWFASKLLKKSFEYSRNLAEQLGAEVEDRKQIEKDIRQLNEELEHRVWERTAQLERANKELESFSYSISHDLRAPLRAIDGFNKIFLETYGDDIPLEGKEHLVKVASAAKKMGRLIDDLLALSHLASRELKYTTLNLTHLVKRKFAELVQEFPGREINLINHHCPLVEVDEHLMDAAISNLLSNAIKFSKERNPAEIEFGFMGEDTDPTFYIKDNGAGFNMKYADKLFSPFQRLHSEKQYNGTGIGLAIVYRVIQYHNGDIWFESEEGKGTTFYFKLNGSVSTQRSEKPL